MRSVQAVLVSLVGFAAAGNIYYPSATENRPAYPDASPSYVPIDPSHKEWEHKDYDNGEKKDGEEYDPSSNEEYDSSPSKEYDSSPSKEYDSSPSKEYDSSPSKEYDPKEKDGEEHKEWENKDDGDKKEWEHKEWENKDDGDKKEWEHKDDKDNKYDGHWDGHEQWQNQWNKTKSAYTTTKIVSQYTTYCPEPTEVTVNKKTYTVTKATTLTITDCPCTVVEVNHIPLPLYTHPAATPNNTMLTLMSLQQPCPTETVKPPTKWDGNKDWNKKPEWDPKKTEAAASASASASAKPEDPKKPEWHDGGDKPHPPPVTVSGASTSFAHVGAAVFGALLVAVMAL
ncbi:hypothetical protein THAR02_08609 [Trichoderma harzianum]|uniref:Uncharacterized protein n=1 Tax=Trichoderma harzianum TaxID=5544 RepID=A0A0G0A1T0_TRIHA|nr:hypothetical protein THAR02_08609 [Trichoderma harzianum]